MKSGKRKKRKRFVGTTQPADYSFWASQSISAASAVLTSEMIEDARDMILWGNPGMYYKRYKDSILKDIVEDKHGKMEGIGLYAQPVILGTEHGIEFNQISGLSEILRGQ